MKITVKIEGQPRHKMIQPYDQCEYVRSREGATCPKCGADPLRVRGAGGEVQDHDSITKTAYCINCDEPIGTIRVRFDTIFGIEEDERVLNSRCRVY